MSISPNVPTPQESYHYDGSVGTPRWIAVLFVLLIIALAALGYVGYTAQSRIEATLAKAQDQNRLLTAQLDQANSRLADLKALPSRLAAAFPEGVPVERIGLAEAVAGTRAFLAP